VSTITYKHNSEEHTVEIGQRYNIKREGSAVDLWLSRAIASDCPVEVGILIRTNGDIDVWYVEFRGNVNPYWHYGDPFQKDYALTDAQKEAICRLRDNDNIYGNLGGYLSAPIIKLAFGEKTEKIAKAFHD
jgi:hypothetical protein